MQRNLRSDILFGIAVLILIYLVWQVADVLLLVYVSALFAVVLAPAINVIRRLRIGGWRPSRAIAIAILIIGVLGIATLLIVLIVPPIANDAAEFAQHFPEKLAGVQDRIRRLPFLENFNLSGLQTSLATMLGGAVGLFRGVACSARSFSRSISSSMASERLIGAYQCFPSTSSRASNGRCIAARTACAIGWWVKRC